MRARLGLVLLCVICVGLAGVGHARSASQARHVGKATGEGVPPSWEILPIPRYVDYGSSKSFVAIKNVAIVRQEGGPYQTVREQAGELVGNSTITEEELTGILKETGVNVSSVSDRLGSYDGFDTLILLGNPNYNKQTDKYFKKMKLSFSRWDDLNTSGHDFNAWKDFGREGYLLMVGRCAGKNIIILAGYDWDDAKGSFYGAGTFYAMQSLRQLIAREDGKVKIKTAEIADKPLIENRGCYGGFDPDPKVVWRGATGTPRIKANQYVWWYGNGLLGYSGGAAKKFRYPWTQEQLKLYSEIGNYCRERFVTMVFCMNPDHYNAEWVAPYTFDGSKKDPLHYNLEHPVEPQFKEMWAKLGYEVNNDVDILAAKFDQLNKLIPGSMLQMMNEDDVFGLVHEEDKKLFQTDTPDAKLNAINYGKARAQILISLYKKVRQMSPSSSDTMPLSPPDGVAYQTPLEKNDMNSRDYMQSFSRELQNAGLRDKMPILTTGAGTAAEVLTSKQIDDFSRWIGGSPVLLHDNNFSDFHIGAYQIDPNGPRTPYQVDAHFPAGYRDKDLYKRLWAYQWNGIDDQMVLAWCMGQFMWNMLAQDREKINQLAARKVSEAESYPLVKSFFEEFDNSACYLPDNGPPYKILFISDKIAFPGEGSNGWEYSIKYTDQMRRESQKLLRKLNKLVPELETIWKNEFDTPAALKLLGYRASSFCTVYLAYGYIEGWQNFSHLDKLDRSEVRDLLIDADNLQERFFAGPEVSFGRFDMNTQYYRSALRYIYTKGAFKPSPASPSEAEYYVDIWKEGLLGKFFKSVSSVDLADISDGDARIAGGWDRIEGANNEKFRTITGDGIIELDGADKDVVLLRMKVGTSTKSLTDASAITLSAGLVKHVDAVCKPRWINWLLPAGADVSKLTIKSEKPVRVYTVELYTEKR
ncbi:MAG: hypothetical protein ACYC64_17455 [Armatimonadota bacterium]